MALTIALADDIEKVVTEQARAAGVSPRDFVNQTLSATLTPNGDPLDEFIGRFESGIPDLGRRHDDYLSATYADRHEEES